jgi:hypothetical protein
MPQRREMLELWGRRGWVGGEAPHRDKREGGEGECGLGEVVEVPGSGISFEM